MRAILAALAFVVPAVAQPAATGFELADVRPTTSTNRNVNRRGPAMRGGRYEIHSATLLDLISVAYSMDPDKVLNGPSWLEIPRYDVIAKAPPNSNLASLKPALQQLLAERFHLVVRFESRALPTYALLPGKKPLMKAGDGTGETGCRPSGEPGRGGSIMAPGPDGNLVPFNVGPGATIQYSCHNVTMAQFAGGLRSMLAADLGPNPVLDRTGLTGGWNFEVKWSLKIIGPVGGNADQRISIFDAVEKQLGLRLEPLQAPLPVILVVSANRQPTANAPDIAARLNIPPLPTEFEVASLKPSDPERRGMMLQRVQPGGRVSMEGATVRNLILQAWNLNPDMLVGLPDWANTDRYDIAAKVTSPEQLEMPDAWPLVRKLLEDGFGLKTHLEERPVECLRLVAVKPKLKSADPRSRSHWGISDPTQRPENPILGRPWEFKNTSMAEFVKELSIFAPGYIRTPVADATGLEGGWDFTLAFSVYGSAGGPQDTSRRGVDGAVEPNGTLTLAEAVEMQLGLKLEPEKRPFPVLVVDHIERKPTEN